MTMPDDATELYKRSRRMDQEPDLDWLLDGIRGLANYGRRARKALWENETVKRTDAVSRATVLLGFMTQLLSPKQKDVLSSALRTSYAALHRELVRANASQSETGFNNFIEACTRLAEDIEKIRDRHRHDVPASFSIPVRSGSGIHAAG